jgi:hypothetical protein
MYKKLRTALMASAAILTATTPYVNSARASDGTRVKIATSSLHENGCSETAQTFKVAIPNHEKLDLNYNKGPAGGIEVVTRENNHGSYGNIALVDDGAAVVYQLSAHGGGHRLSNPFNGGNVCVDASGANITIEVYAHYKDNG